ncbi:unnamed protein product [marine sediment metagenome]|uniref:Uncharacterized protein n=1 Tax=marine sediment metagenome TaxID=412755 RepID=X1HMM2_9ZZZZ
MTDNELTGEIPGPRVPDYELRAEVLGERASDHELSGEIKYSLGDEVGCKVLAPGMPHSESGGEALGSCPSDGEFPEKILRPGLPDYELCAEAPASCRPDGELTGEVLRARVTDNELSREASRFRLSRNEFSGEILRIFDESAGYKFSGQFLDSCLSYNELTGKALCSSTDYEFSGELCGAGIDDVESSR